MTVTQHYAADFTVFDVAGIIVNNNKNGTADWPSRVILSSKGPKAEGFIWTG